VYRAAGAGRIQASYQAQSATKPAIVMVKRTGLPLTPAAGLFADVLLRLVP